MSLRLFHVALVYAIALTLGMNAHAGMTADTPYTDRGKTDFDTVLQLLNPYGTWSKIDGKWAFTPRDHQTPYTNGRWLYTEYGWYWKGRAPHSWATEHYGYWKRSDDKVWSWFPGPYWLPQIVEIRSTDHYIGWRSGEVDGDGNFVETPIDRFSKPDEWTFVTLAQFANPITPASAAPIDVTREQLDDSVDSHHVYLTYREIDRPGPHPADFANLPQDGGMLPPKSLADRLAEQRPAPSTPATNSSAAIRNGTNQPTLLGAPTDPAVDTRKVKYWITMSLPTYWTPPPLDAKSDQVYSYRPDFYQDDDGIARRITLWFNPKAKATLSDILSDNSPSPASNAKPGADTSATPAIPATEASDTSENPFRSPLDEPLPSGGISHSSPSSSKNPAPSGLAAPGSSPDTNDASALPK